MATDAAASLISEAYLTWKDIRPTRVGHSSFTIFH
jgi:hypothetical protein